MSGARNKDFGELVQALLLVENADEAQRFLRDLLTDSEIAELAARWRAARMLEQGDSYARITDVTGLSSTTVARVSRWVKKGTGGYRLVLSRLPKAKSKRGLRTTL